MQKCADGNRSEEERKKERKVTDFLSGCSGAFILKFGIGTSRELALTPLTRDSWDSKEKMKKRIIYKIVNISLFLALRSTNTLFKLNYSRGHRLF